MIGWEFSFTFAVIEPTGAISSCTYYSLHSCTYRPTINCRVSPRGALKRGTTSLPLARNPIIRTRWFFGPFPPDQSHNGKMIVKKRSGSWKRCTHSIVPESKMMKKNNNKWPEKNTLYYLFFSLPTQPVNIDDGSQSATRQLGEIYWGNRALLNPAMSLSWVLVFLGIIS